MAALLADRLVARMDTPPALEPWPLDLKNSDLSALSSSQIRELLRDRVPEYKAHPEQMLTLSQMWAEENNRSCKQYIALGSLVEVAAAASSGIVVVVLNSRCAN
jgi:hypothetical protein